VSIAPTPIVALAAAPDSGPAWNMLARTGRFDLSMGGSQAFTPALFQSLVDSFAASMAAGRWPIGAPVGVNHARMRGALDAESTKSLGYIVEMEVRSGAGGPGSELWGLIDWTDEGRARVAGREFQGGSIEFAMAADDANDVDFIGHTVTNHPAVARLTQLAADKEIRMDEQTTIIDTQRAQLQALSERLSAAEARCAELAAEVAAHVEAKIAADVEILCAEGRVPSTDAGRQAGRTLVAAMGLDGARAGLPAPVAVAADRKFPTAPIGTDGTRAVDAPVTLDDLRGLSLAEIRKHITPGALTAGLED